MHPGILRSRLGRFQVKPGMTGGGQARTRCRSNAKGREWGQDRKDTNLSLFI